MMFVIAAAALGIVVGLAFAYGSMRLVIGFIQSTVRQFIARQRERRSEAREGADRRLGVWP